jgi:hypothetical protein
LHVIVCVGASMPKASKGKSDDNNSILEYALSHLEREYAEIQNKIELVKRQLGWSAKAMAVVFSAPPEKMAPSAPAAAPSAPAATRKKRVLSPAARKRIAIAQKKRWAEHRKAKGAKA